MNKKLSRHLLANCKLVFFLVLTTFFLPAYLLGKYAPIIVPNNLAFIIRSIWSKIGLWLCNIEVKVNGNSNEFSSVYACNHVSWLDILVLQSILNISFVAKSEVKRWPIFGFLARIADTVFIDRRKMAALDQQIDLTGALDSGQTLCLFPEGTSTDGSHVLPFKSSLFEVFISLHQKNCQPILVQPVSLVYHHLDEDNKVGFGWWGDMSLIGHIYEVAANVKLGRVEVNFESPIDSKKIGDRKKLALAAELAVKRRFKI